MPDAEVLIRMASVLEISVSKLLGLEDEPEKSNVSYAELAEALAKVNEELAKRKQKELLRKKANEKGVIIWSLSFAAVFAILLIKNSAISIIVMGVCMFLALIVLYRNLALLTMVTTDDLRLKTLRITTIFSITVLVLCVFMAILTAMDIIVFTEYSEQMFATLLLTGIMVFMGIVAPKLPFTRHTGLRLPWTVADEDTWNVAHRIMGYISLPMALLYFVCALTIPNFEMVTLTAVILWIGTPGGMSFIYYYKKVHGNLWD